MKCKVSLTKAVKGALKTALKGNVKAVQDTFVLQDNGDNTCTVLGVDAAGNTADISSVATLAVVSDNETVLTVDAPVGATFAMHAKGPLGSANVAVTVTWNDGSIGPFNATLPVNVIAGPVTGVVIVPGTPTSH